MYLFLLCITCADDTHYKFNADFITVFYFAYKHINISPLGIQPNLYCEQNCMALGHGDGI